MKVIDTHIHIFEKPYSDLFDNSHIKDGESGDLHLYEEYRRKYDIELAFVICYDEGHCPENTFFVKALSEKYKWIHSFGYVRPGTSFQKNAEKLIADGHFGISCYLKKEDTGEWLCSQDFSAFQNDKIPLSLTIFPAQCGMLRKVLCDFPEMTVLINHMGRPSSENMKYYDDILSLSQFDNVYIKLSGFYAFSSGGWRCPQKDLFYVINLLKKNYGSERLMFASDFSPVLEFNTYRQTLEMLRLDYNSFSEKELENIYYSNAKKIIERRGKNDS